jgi:hypothetical protein
MPVPGPRTQYGPDPGYTNPGREVPTRFNMWGRPAPVAEMGRTPGLMEITLRGNVLGAGQIRRLWRQSINFIAAQAPYSWTSSTPNPGDPDRPAPGLAITRALRYMTRSVYMGSGIDNTRFYGLHTQVLPRVRSKPVTVGAGQVRTRPTVRNRITSFGSRVPAINQPVVGAEQGDTLT